MSKPIRPEEVGSAKVQHIPAAVFDAFNAEIAIQFADGSAVVKQNAVLERLKAGGMLASEIFTAGWLNVEDAYRAAGWKVSYQKPGLGEDGPAIFTFKSNV